MDQFGFDLILEKNKELVIKKTLCIEDLLIIAD